MEVSDIKELISSLSPDQIEKFINILKNPEYTRSFLKECGGKYCNDSYYMSIEIPDEEKELSTEQIKNRIKAFEAQLSASILPLPTRCYNHTRNKSVSRYINEVGTSGGPRNVGKISIPIVEYSYDFFREHLKVEIVKNPRILYGNDLFFKDREEKTGLFLPQRREIYNYIHDIGNDGLYLFSDNANHSNVRNLFSSENLSTNQKLMFNRINQYLINYSSVEDLRSHNTSSFQKFLNRMPYKKDGSKEV